MKPHSRNSFVYLVSFMAMFSLVFSLTYSANGGSSGYPFSDGFESGDFSGWSGTRHSTSDTIFINTTYTHQGNYSAELTTNGGETREHAYCYVRSDSSASDLYARAYFKITSSGISAAVDSRFSLIVFKAGTNAIAFAGWRKTTNGVRWSLLIRDSLGWVTKYSASNPSVNRWYSVELHWFKDDANGHAELFVDGDLACVTAGGNTADFGSINEVDFGIASTLNCTGMTVYLDSAAVQTTYIGMLPSDEWFTSIEYLPLDTDGDGSYDSVSIRFNVDTSSATANVTVVGIAGTPIYPSSDPFDIPDPIGVATWTVYNKKIEYGFEGYNSRSYFGSGAGSGMFSFMYTLFDDVGNIEDFRVDMNVIYLSSSELGYFVRQDGFENGDFRLENGVKTTSGETALVTNEFSHAGSYSAKFMTDGDGGYESSYFYWTSGNEPAARAYFNVVTSGIDAEMERFGLIQMEVAGKVVVSGGWRRVNGIDRWSLTFWNGTDWVVALSNETASAGQWHYVELYCGNAQTLGFPQIYWGEEIELWVDGVMVCRITDDCYSTVEQAKSGLVKYRLGLSQLVNCDSTTVYVDQAEADFYFWGPT